MEQESLIKALLARYQKYQTMGLDKEQIFKVFNKTEFALLSFYFMDKEIEEKKRLSSNNVSIELAEIVNE